MADSPSRFLYPKQPVIEGALPRQVLLTTARKHFVRFGGRREMSPKTFVHVGAISDQDLLAAAFLLGSKPSIEQALSAGVQISGGFTNLLYKCFTLVESGHPSNPVRSMGKLHAVESSTERLLESLDSLVLRVPGLANELSQVVEPLVSAALQYDNLELLQYLYRRDPKSMAYIETDPVLTLCVTNPYGGRCLEWLLPRFTGCLLNEKKGSYKGRDALVLLAAETNNLERMNFLAQKGVPLDVKNVNGWNLLHWIVLCDRPGKEIDTYISGIFRLAGRKKTEQLLSHVDNLGVAPIHMAAQVCYGVDWLKLAPGGNVNVRTGVIIYTTSKKENFSGVTPLGVSLLSGNFKGALELLASGADPYRISAEGHSAWHVLAAMTSVELKHDVRSFKLLVELLDRLKVDCEQTNDKGLAPLDISCSDEMSALLAKRRAQRLKQVAMPHAVSSSAKSAPLSNNAHKKPAL